MPSASEKPVLRELPVLGADHRERADAARNRTSILDAAERLFAERSVDCVTMDAIACAAGVGKGTLFRRFGDRANLFRALLDERERAFQEAFIRGPAPLGPGASAKCRLVAFGHALLDLIEIQGDLLAAAETGPPGVRLGADVYVAHRAHVTALLREAAPTGNSEYVADVLLGALAAGVVLYQRRVREMPLAELKAYWADLVGRLT